MSNQDSPEKSSRTWPWIASALVVGAICVAITYRLTGSLQVSILEGVMLIGCLALGWWAATMAYAPVDPDLKDSQEAALILSPKVDQNDSGNATNRFARQAIEATPIPVIIVEQNGRIVATNMAARTRFVITDKQAKFNNIVRRPDLIEGVEAVFKDRQPRHYAVETRVPVDRFERVSIAAFDARGGVFVLVSMQDETEVRMSERMRADFLANASHELRTPLAAIIGFIETLRGPARDDEIARTKFLEVMHAQADRMSRLISDLLSLSRIELNERVAPTGACNLTAAVFEAIDCLTPDKKKRIIAPKQNEQVWVLGERDELAQVISNLFDNAFKYGAFDGDITVSLTNDLGREAAVTYAMRQWDSAARLPLTSPPVEPERLYAVLRVEDHGEGIERQYLPRLAERFFRVADTASGKSGTGLGLAIVKHIVSRHRGGLVVESESGRGSAFAVYLPQPD
jgi:two-component system, OmpR family, phosphate regulon sensor histidine kinase PhoR